MMYKRILIAEDVDNEQLGICSFVSEHTSAKVDRTPYCDKALMMLTQAREEGQAYDLLLTDLSFQQDHHPQQLSGGLELVEAVKKQIPDQKIIVFSAESKSAIIKELINNLEVNAYVCKGRHGLKELGKALTAVANTQQFTCPIAYKALSSKNIIELNEYDKKILFLLANGYKQGEISSYFAQENISPSGIRSIESKISKLRDAFNAKNNTQLVFIAQSLGLIGGK
ncbi:MAG: response regulator [Flavobacteriaceae bacterium]|nr:response regulator [Flavobacteriaceae bacterium]